MKWNHTTIHLKMFRMSYKTTIQRHLNTFRLIKILPMGFMPTMSNSVLWQFNSQSAWNEQTKTKSWHFRDFYFSIVCNQIWFLWLLNGATYKKIDLKSPFSFSFDVFLFFVVVEKKTNNLQCVDTTKLLIVRHPPSFYFLFAIAQRIIFFHVVVIGNYTAACHEHRNMVNN